jgi:hypothetical protein
MCTLVSDFKGNWKVKKYETAEYQVLIKFISRFANYFMWIERRNEADWRLFLFLYVENALKKRG